MTTLEEISALTRPHHPDDWTELDSAAVDTVRVLAADAVQKVGNGHPGTAMSLAPLAYTLFQRQMRHDPSDAHWLGRDRFVLSCGHSSLTLYIQLYLGGFGLELSDIESLRTWGSKTPGPPGVPAHQGRGDHHRPAGPGPGLRGRHGDGVALRARPVRPRRRAGHQPVRPLHLRDRLRRRHRGGRHRRGVVAGRHPAARQPHRVLRPQPDLDRGRHQHRAVRGHRRPATAAYGWHVQEVEGGENVVGIEEAIAEAKAVTDKPSFIAVRTIIGYPAPNEDEHRQGARRRPSATRRSPPSRRSSASTRTRRSRCATRSSSTPASWCDRGKEAHEKWQSGVRRVGRARARAQGAAGPADRRRSCPTAGTPT